MKMKRSFSFGAIAIALLALAGLFLSQKRPTEGPRREGHADLEQLRRAAKDLAPTEQTRMKPPPRFVLDLQKEHPHLFSASEAASLPPLSNPDRRPGEREAAFKLRSRTIAQIPEFQRVAEISPDQATAIRKLLVDTQIAFVVGMEELHRQYAAAGGASPNMGGDTEQLFDALQSRMDVEFRRILTQRQLDILYGVPGRTPLGRFSSMRSAIAMSARPFDMNEREALKLGERG